MINLRIQPKVYRDRESRLKRKMKCAAKILWKFSRKDETEKQRDRSAQKGKEGKKERDKNRRRLTLDIDQGNCTCCLATAYLNLEWNGIRKNKTSKYYFY